MDIFSWQNLEFGGFLRYSDQRIEKNQITFITGPSGVGKTTLLRLLNTTQSPSDGSIYYDGKDTAEMDTISLRREVILTGQSVYLFPTTIEENFHLFHQYQESSPPTSKSIANYLNICHSNFSLTDSCQPLSGGERQRIFLAVALSLKPRALLLDEPTSALDQSTAQLVLTNLFHYCKQQDITPVIVSHDSKLRQKYADNTLCLGGVCHE